MSNEFKIKKGLVVEGDARVTGAILDSTNAPGTSGQVLTSTVTGTDWKSLAEISGVDGTGTANYLSKWADADTITNSIVYDNGTNVGIGTVSPLTGGGAAKWLTLEGTTYGGGIISSVSGVAKGYVYYDNASNSFALQAEVGIGATVLTNNTERMRITSGGNVGIGTTSPADKLHVDGGIYANPVYAVAISGTGAPYYGTNITLASDVGATAGATRMWSRYDGTGYAATSFERATNSQAYNSDPRLLTYAESMRISGNGNVGIGTTAPASKLQVDGGSYSFIAGYDSGNRRVYIGLDSAGEPSIQGALSNASARQISINPSGGNVGIGTTSPSQKLDVTGNIAANSIYLYDSTSNDRNVLDLDGSDNLQISTGTSTGSRAITFFTEGSERMRITAASNVGIGTTSPSEKLHVAGNILSSNVILWNNGNGALTWDTNLLITEAIGAKSLGYNTNGSERMRITSDGNVGIGTTSPSYKTTIYDSSLNTDVLTVSNNQINSDGVQRFVGISLQDQYANGTGNVSAIRSYSNLYSQWGSTLTFSTTGDGGNGVLERMRIAAAGNVGIGTTSPNNAKLVISDTGSNKISIDGGTSQNGMRWEAVGGANTFYLYNGTSGTAGFGLYNVNTAATPLWIQNGGNVGIGTTAPGIGDGSYVAPLTINSASTLGTFLAIKNTQASYGMGGVWMQANTGDAGWLFGTENDGKAVLHYGSGASETAALTDAKDGTKGITIDTAGNVGIGTTSPQGKLEVNNRNTATGAALFIKGGEDDLDPIAGQYTGLAFGYGGGEIYNNGGILWEFTNAAANGKLHFAVNPTAGDGTVNLTDSKMTILDSGNVGIGTTSPDLGAIAGTRVLTIASPETERWGILELAGNRTWGGNQVGEIKFISTDATNNGTLVSLTAVNDTTALGTGGSLNFATRANGGSLTTKMSITSTGNVGIGTTTPFGTAANRTVLSVNGTTDVSLNVGTGGSQRAYLYGSSTYADLGTIGSLPLVFSPNNTERMRITSSGNVGIGTTSPGGLGEKLTVIGSINSNNTALFYGDGTDNSANLYSTAGPIKFLANASERMRIDSSGNVGIGTTAPSADLHIYENGPSTLLIESAAANGNDTYLALKNSAAEWRLTTNRGDQITGAQGDFFIRENDSLGNAFVIKQNTGNVGIGTTTPSHKLHVSGDRIVVENITDAGIMFRTASVDRYSVASTSGDFQIYDEVNSVNRLAITSGGDVGIGITSPTEKLDVDGVVNATSFSAGGTAGFTGTVNFPSNPPGSQSLDFQGGLLVGVS